MLAVYRGFLLCLELLFGRFRSSRGMFAMFLKPGLYGPLSEGASLGDQRLLNGDYRHVSHEMETSRGLEGGPPPPRRLSRTLTTVNFQDVRDPEVVPSSLAVIAPFLRVANEIEDNAPRVAYLCRFYAFDRAHKLDQASAGRGVRQFKTALLRKLEKDDEPTLRLRSGKNDAREMQNYYQEFYEKYAKSLERSAGDSMDRAQLARTYQTAAVLFDVLTAVNSDNKEVVDSDVIKKAQDVQVKKEVTKP